VVQGTISLTSNARPYYGNPVQFTINIPTIGTVAATGKINILDGRSRSVSVTLTSARCGHDDLHHYRPAARGARPRLRM